MVTLVAAWREHTTARTLPWTRSRWTPNSPSAERRQLTFTVVPAPERAISSQLMFCAGVAAALACALFRGERLLRRPKLAMRRSTICYLEV